MKKKTPELKPCPFCGGKAEYESEEGCHWVGCTECETYATTTHASRAEAARVWNRRTP